MKSYRSSTPETHITCQSIGAHFCGDGLLETGKEVCDPADLNKVNWGSGGCSAKCQPQ